jgi:hypothetical protein
MARAYVDTSHTKASNYRDNENESQTTLRSRGLFAQKENP